MALDEEAGAGANAIERDNLLVAETTLREFGRPSTEELLLLTALICRKQPERGRRVKARFLERYLQNAPSATIDDASLVATLLAALGARRSALGARRSSARSGTRGPVGQPEKRLALRRRVPYGQPDAAPNGAEALGRSARVRPPRQRGYVCLGVAYAATGRLTPSMRARPCGFQEDGRREARSRGMPAEVRPPGVPTGWHAGAGRRG
jgi:hypothetical protein